MMKIIRSVSKVNKRFAINTILVSLMFFVIMSISGCNKYIKITKSSIEYLGIDYTVVESELKNAGFDNIKLVKLDDLTSKNIMQDNKVSSISINGTKSFEANNKFPQSAEVIIEYHVVPKIQVPYSKQELENSSCEELEKLFYEANFLNVTSSEAYDLDPDEIKVDNLISVAINNSLDWSKNDLVPFDSDVSIVKHYKYEKYNADIHIDFIGNLLFNKYNIDIYLDDEKLKSLNHGESGDFNIRCKAGTYTIIFKNSSNDKVTGSANIELNDNKEASYKIQCEESYIAVKELMMRSAPKENEIKIPHSSSDYSSKNYQEVQRSLTEAGFTNVSTKAVYDIYWGITEVGSVSSVSINGCKKFSKNDIFQKDAQIIISYHMNENDDPDVIAAKKEEEKKRKDEEERKKEEEKKKEKEERKKRYEESIQLKKIKESLEKNAPKEMAMRAIVVAMTNGQAIDVFKNDGCTYDIKKFHSYNELGDFFLSVRYEGNWTVYSETTWKVENMILAIHDHQARIKIDCYITRVNDEYKLLKVKKVIAAEDYLYSEDPSKINIEYIDASDKTNCPFLTVPLKLIEKGRE